MTVNQRKRGREMYGNSGLRGMLRHDTPDCSKVNPKTLEKWIRRGGKFAQLVSQGLEREA